jgi:A/G-specific adenine glycosylase
MLVAINRGEVLLEKRPARGIWGGLWSLPECGRRTSRAVAEPLEPFTHAFTHFTLEVMPWKCAMFPARANRWCGLRSQTSRARALPSPVKKLLRRSASAASGTDAAPRGASKRR